LGIFMHLSAFSVPAFKNEWYASNMYYADDIPNLLHPEYRKMFRDHHEKTYGALKEFGYKDFIPMLTLEKFDADYYAELIKKSGAAYFAAPAVHHDGFAMWDSKVIDWNAARMGPKRDVVGELTEAMRKKGIKTGVSTHYGRHWKYYTFRPEFDTWDPANEGLYGKRRGDTDPPRPQDALKWEQVMNELVDNYQPDYIFVDGGVCDARSEYKKNYYHDAMYRVTARYYNQSVKLNKGVVISWKRDAMEKGEAVYDTEGTLERGIPKRPWQAHFTVNGKWAYCGERPATPMDAILRCFIDVVSRNGNLLLNIGPRPDGTLELNQENVLLELGKWMAINGEGITGSKPWNTWGSGKLSTLAGGKGINDYEKDAVRYTQKDGALYAWFVTWPENGKVVLPQAASFDPSMVKLMGGKAALEFYKEGDALVVELSDWKDVKSVWGLKLTKDEDKAENDLAAVAAAAVAMSGGDDSGEPLPTRYRLAKPAPIPKGGEWFKKAGLGLFIHWGPASVPDIEDVWRIRQPIKGSNPLRPKVTPKFYYDNAPKGFTAENYNPRKWMSTAKKAGFRYAVLTSKHHDGYSLWPSKHTNFGVQTYLNRRDLLQPYVDAVRGNDMKVGFYFSGVDWNLDRDYMNYYFSRGKEGWDFLGNPMPQDAVEPLPMEIVEQKKQMVFEVMERYRPDLWWWDSGLPLTMEETAGKYNPEMVFNNRGNWYHEGTLKGTYPVTHYATPEGFPSLEWKHVKQLMKTDTPWEVCMTFQRCGWFYNSPIGDETGSLEDILYALARVRSWQGNLLLNVSPRADGSLPEAVYENFEIMAGWMKWGGVSMFDTKGTHFPERSNVPITTSRDAKTWYLHARPGPQTDAEKWGKWKKIYYIGTEPGKPIRVRDVPKLQSVKLLRTGERVSYYYEHGALVISNPAAGPNGLHEVIELKFW
jgi:alpha-L-fucosidase